MSRLSKCKTGKNAADFDDPDVMILSISYTALLSWMTCPFVKQGIASNRHQFRMVETIIRHFVMYPDPLVVSILFF